MLKFAPLFSLYGARNLSKRILTNKLGVNSRLNFTFIKQNNFLILNNMLQKSFVGKKLFNSIKNKISFLTTNKTYKGLRHKLSLPTRGQRTHTNAKTCKKKSRRKG